MHTYNAHEMQLHTWTDPVRPGVIPGK